MFRILGLVLFVGWCCLGGQAPVREVTSDALRAGMQLVPGFQRGYIYWIGRDGADVVTIYAPEGRHALTFVSENRPVRGISIADDGSVVVSWGTWNSTEGGGIDWRDKYGRLIRSVKTPRYLPVHVSMVGDGSVWTFGAAFDAATHEDPNGMLLRHFRPSGELIGTYLPRSTFSEGMSPAAEVWQIAPMMVSGNRVGLLAFSGDDSSKFEWLEVGSDGNVLGRWNIDSFGGGTPKVTMTADGCVYGQQWDNPGQLHRLDRKTGTWQALSSTPAGRLEGADRDLLVFSDPVFGPIHLRWYEHDHVVPAATLQSPVSSRPGPR